MPTYAEINSASNLCSVSSDLKRCSPLRLIAGLAITAQDEPENPIHNYRSLASSLHDPLLDNWDVERLAPSSCNLRSVVLMANGIPTGAKSLAQETRPAAAGNFTA